MQAKGNPVIPHPAYLLLAANMTLVKTWNLKLFKESFLVDAFLSYDEADV